MTDHAEAAYLLLMIVLKKLQDGTPPEELGREISLIGRMMERRT